MNIFGKKIRLERKIAPDEFAQKVSEAYMMGVNDTVKELKDQVEKLNKELKKTIDDSYVEAINIKKAYEQKIKEYENRMKDKCNQCQKTTDKERSYIRNLQSILSTQLKKLDLMFSRMKQYLDDVKDHHATIMTEAGKVASTDHMILSLQRDFNELVQFATPLLEANLVEREFIDKYNEGKDK